MTSIILGSSGKQFNGFKLSNTKGTPTYLAPKLLTSIKQEEFFVANIYAQHMIFNGLQVMGIEVCKDDSNKGADVIISTEEDKISLQVTRFTLTSYLQRKHVAMQRAIKIATEVIRYGSVPIPVNVTLHSSDTMKIPVNKKKYDLLLGQEISRLIKYHITELETSPSKFINCVVTNERIKNLTHLITLQYVPVGYNSNYHGKDNVFINNGFDNVGFSEKDVEDEAANIYRKKNEGKSTVLLIWIDEAEILRKSELFIKHLQNAFRKTTFERVLLFSFYNDKHLYFTNPVNTFLIFDKDLLVK